MSDSNEEANYYAAIEAYFVERRGSPLFITPQEWHLIHKWEQRGIPIAIVKDGIDRAFESPKAHQRVRKLSYCRQSVEAAQRRFQEARAGENERSVPSERTRPPNDRTRLQALAAALSETAESLSRQHSELAEWLASSATKVSDLGNEFRSPFRIESALAELDAELLSRLSRHLTDSERSGLRAQAEAALDSYRDRMPGSVFDAAVESAYRRRVRARMQLPPLTLFGAS